VKPMFFISDFILEVICSRGKLGLMVIRTFSVVNWCFYAGSMRRLSMASCIFHEDKELSAWLLLGLCPTLTDAFSKSLCALII
jgi:hypothetical protein